MSKKEGTELGRNMHERKRGYSYHLPPLLHPPPLGWELNSYIYTQADIEIQSCLSHPPSGRALIPPAVVLLDYWLQQWACSAPLCSALAAACISPTEESAEPCMRLHTEQATYSLEELNTHTEVREIFGILQDYTTYWRYYLLAWYIFIIRVLRNK